MNKWYILLLLCALAACKTNNVDFGYSPVEPKAGEKIQFTNLSTSGEDWEWDFGDATNSTLKNPAKIYKQPGTYTITLKVDNKSSWTKTKSITIYDTIPGIECSVENADSLGIDIFSDVSLSALVYNPYKYKVEYFWTITGAEYTMLSENNESEKFSFYVSQSETKQFTIGLKVTLNGQSRDIVREYKVNNVPAPALLMMDEDSVYWSQRIFGSRAEEVTLLTYEEGIQLLDEAQDTFQIYNNYTVRLADLQAMVEDMIGFRIASRKIYYRTPDGLFVSNIDGTYPEQIDAQEVNALATDVVNNRIYWASDSAVFYMPLIGSENNKFTTEPVQINAIPSVVKLAVDPIER